MNIRQNTGAKKQTKSKKRGAVVLGVSYYRDAKKKRRESEALFR